MAALVSTKTQVESVKESLCKVNAKLKYKEIQELVRFFASQSIIFQLCWDWSSLVEPVLSLLKDTIQ